MTQKLDDVQPIVQLEIGHVTLLKVIPPTLLKKPEKAPSPVPTAEKSCVTHILQPARGGDNVSRRMIMIICCCQSINQIYPCPKL